MLLKKELQSYLFDTSKDDSLKVPILKSEQKHK